MGQHTSNKRRANPMIGAAIAAVVVLGTGVAAEPMLLTHEGTASGTLRLSDDSGRVISFSNADFVITAISDTDDRRELFINPTEPAYGYDMAHQSASVEIDGVGTFAFLTETRTFAIRDVGGAGRVGFGRTAAEGGLDLFNGPVLPEFGDWDMTTDIELSSDGGGSLIQWDALPVETDGGVLTLWFDVNAPWRFTATTVPTPASLVLLGGAALFARRRR